MIRLRHPSGWLNPVLAVPLRLHAPWAAQLMAEEIEDPERLVVS
ncbi:hypothetical protein [Singulisphaera acidiphila]|nr:hypothetical protein [Singulisphaera acidiphila]